MSADVVGGCAVLAMGKIGGIVRGGLGLPIEREVIGEFIFGEWLAEALGVASIV
jgi:hypothetical protein